MALRSPHREVLAVHRLQGHPEWDIFHRASPRRLQQGMQHM